MVGGVAPRARNAPAKRALDGTVGVSHRREVGLRLDRQVERAEPRQAELVGKLRELEREDEVDGLDRPSLLVERFVFEGGA